MVNDVIRQWLVCRELMVLAQRENFDHVVPDRVQRALHVLGVVKSSSELSNVSYIDLGQTRRLRRALARIWELSRDQYDRDHPQRFQWHRVMACCNTIYSQCEEGAQKKTSSSSTQSARKPKGSNKVSA